MRPILVGAGVLAAFLGGLTLGGTRPPPARSAAAPRTVEAAPPPAVDLAPLRREIRAVLREELAAARPAAAPAPAAEPSAEALAAAAEAHRIVEAARGARRWSQADVLALRAVMPRLPVEERTAILETLLPALNSGEIRPDDDVIGAPL